MERSRNRKSFSTSRWPSGRMEIWSLVWEWQSQMKKRTMTWTMILILWNSSSQVLDNHSYTLQIQRNTSSTAGRWKVSWGKSRSRMRTSRSLEKLQHSLNPLRNKWPIWKTSQEPRLQRLETKTWRMKRKSLAMKSFWESHRPWTLLMLESFRKHSSMSIRTRSTPAHQVLQNTTITSVTGWPSARTQSKPTQFSRSFPMETGASTSRRVRLTELTPRQS